MVWLWSLWWGCGTCPAPAKAPAAEAGSAVASSTSFDPMMAMVCQAGCAAKVDYEPEDVVAQPGAVVGDLTQCPVSGVVFEVRPEQPNYERDGKTWFTCCGGCIGKLEANPTRFIGG